MNMSRLFLLVAVLASGCTKPDQEAPKPDVVPVAPSASAIPSASTEGSAGLTFAQWPETILGFPLESDLLGFQAACTKAGGTLAGSAKTDCSKTAAGIGVGGQVARVACKDGSSLCSYFLFPDDKDGDAFRSFRRKLISKYGEPTFTGNRTAMVDAVDSECKVLKEAFGHLDRWRFKGASGEREIAILGSCKLGQFTWSASYFVERGVAESDAARAEARKNF